MGRSSPISPTFNTLNSKRDAVWQGLGKVECYEIPRAGDHLSPRASLSADQTQSGVLLLPLRVSCQPLGGGGEGVRGPGQDQLGCYCSCHFLPGPGLLGLLGMSMEWLNSAPGPGCLVLFL